MNTSNEERSQEEKSAFVFIEVSEGRIKAEDAMYESYLDVVNAIHERMGFRRGRVYLLKAKSIPLTHNGKIQHMRLRDVYLGGSLRASGRIL